MISVVIPVYNRPQEVAEILASLALQTYSDFETVIVEDGSSCDCRLVVDSYRDRLNIRYLHKENAGPGPARNYGARHATGDFLIFLDSDCIVPPGYMEVVHHAVYACGVEVFGGPDQAADDFSPMQRAVSYSMTSFLTTGGIRGGRRKLDRFFPRSFNMGISRARYEQVGGFAPMRFGEDIDLSYRLSAAGAKPVLLVDAWVCHKRRTDLRAFFRQVFFSGAARINLTLRHPGTLRMVHLLPAAFTAGSFGLLVAGIVWSAWCFVPLGGAALVWGFDAGMRNRSLRVGWLAVWTSFVQLYGYGTGFFYAVWMRRVLGRSEERVNKTRFF